jgi:two-component system sensor histidine kinase KdpD
VQLKREWAALEELVGAVLARYRDTLAGRQINIDLPPDLPLVYCDEVLIDQVLGNLVENAQKHAPGSAIRIAAEVERGAIAVSVRDEGPGLPVGAERRVFEKFQRGHDESAQSGFGLGLTISKAIIEAHGGTIGARNLANGGAEFRFTLPLVAEPNPEQRTAPA